VLEDVGEHGDIERLVGEPELACAPRPQPAACVGDGLLSERRVDACPIRHVSQLLQLLGQCAVLAADFDAVRRAWRDVFIDQIGQMTAENGVAGGPLFLRLQQLRANSAVRHGCLRHGANPPRPLGLSPNYAQHARDCWLIAMLP
jgi:hypothetical protein